jgi:hypothetical protein
MIGESDCGAIGGMKIGRGNRCTRRKPAQRHFVHHKSHLTRQGSNSGRRGGKPATNHLSCGAAINLSLSLEENVELQDVRLTQLDVMGEDIMFQQLEDENWKIDLTLLNCVSEDLKKLNGMFHGKDLVIHEVCTAVQDIKTKRLLFSKNVKER